MTPSKVQQASLFSAKPSNKKTAARKKTAAKKPDRFDEVWGKKPRPTVGSKLPANKRLWLSATAIESMKRCPRCFWLEKREGIRQPEGIVSRLANRFDGVIKQYFDLYRPHGEIPPMIAGQVKGKLQYPFQEKYWHAIDDRYGFFGKLDECLVTTDGKYTPVDHKTSSSDPNGRELIPAYQFQLNAYAFLLERNARPTTGIGHLIYFYPSAGDRLHEGFPMSITVKTLRTDAAAVMPEIRKAITLIEGSMPSPSLECVFCQYVDRRRALD